MTTQIFKRLGKLPLALMAVAVAVAFSFTPVHADTVKYVAHAGYMANDNMRINTKDAFEAAGQRGFWGCECDINEAKSGVILTTHDASIDGKPLKKYNYKTAINKINSRTDGKYKNKGAATFGDFARACKKYNMVPVVEVKSGMTKDGIKRSVAFLHKTGILDSQTIYLGFRDKPAEYAAYAKKYARSKYGVKIKAIVTIKNAKDTSKAKKFAKKYGMNGICICDSQINSTFSKDSKGMEKHAWVYGHRKVYTLAEIQRMGDYGIQTVIANEIPQK